MPVKRSINLVLIDEKKIKPMKALPAILLIIVLAALFSKFMVVDRLMAMSRASGMVTSVQSSLTQATEALKQYDGVEDAYAHLTYKDMTQEELSRVDRVKVLEMVSTYLSDSSARTWSLSGNIMVVDVSGKTLESLNLLARRIEQSPIVDTCVITTAQKEMSKGSSLGLTNSSQSLSQALEKRRQELEGTGSNPVLSAMSSALSALTPETVMGRFTIYLCQPKQPDPTKAPEATAAPEQTEADAGTEAEPSSTEEAGQESQSTPPAQTGAKKPARASRAASVPEEVSAP